MSPDKCLHPVYSKAVFTMLVCCKQEHESPINDKFKLFFPACLVTHPQVLSPKTARSLIIVPLAQILVQQQLIHFSFQELVVACHDFD